MERNCESQQLLAKNTVKYRKGKYLGITTSTGTIPLQPAYERRIPDIIGAGAKCSSRTEVILKNEVTISSCGPATQWSVWSNQQVPLQLFYVLLFGVYPLIFILELNTYCSEPLQQVLINKFSFVLAQVSTMSWTLLMKPVNCNYSSLKGKAFAL